MKFVLDYTIQQRIKKKKKNERRKKNLNVFQCGERVDGGGGDSINFRKEFGWSFSLVFSIILAYKVFALCCGTTF